MSYFCSFGSRYFPPPALSIYGFVETHATREAFGKTRTTCLRSSSTRAAYLLAVYGHGGHGTAHDAGQCPTLRITASQRHVAIAEAL